MNVWWRPEPLDEKEIALLALVYTAHDHSARRRNLSAEAVAQAALGSGNYFQSMAAALLTMGGTHGPIEQTMCFLGSTNPSMHVQEMLKNHTKIPGWGNGFFKGMPDALWTNVDALLKEHYPLWHAKLNDVTAVLHKEGKKIFPNPSAYTAVAAFILGVPRESAAYLLVAGRLAAWTELFQRFA